MQKLRKLEPSFRQRVWGARDLAPWFPNLTPPTSEAVDPVGEVWFQAEEIPLLVKFLFTKQNLSVQVHPDDVYARRHHDSLGKTEMWHVLAAEPGAKIAAGFRKMVTREQLAEAAVSGEIENLLEWHDAAAGDTFFIPAGTVHAIGAGLTICEIQQYSDVTYRLYDYGRGRELHLEHSLAVSNLGPHAARVTLPVACKAFLTEHIQTGLTPPNTAQFVIALEGEGSIGGTPIRAGEVALLPSGVDGSSEGDLKLLRTLVPAS
jgi:mannose-6-phosphate isomerase